MLLRQIARQAPRVSKFLGGPCKASLTLTALRAMSTSAGASLAALASESPHVDVVRYEHKNLKMTLKGVDHNASALAAGLVDCGLVPGDVVLSWLPSHFAEQHVLQFACSKAGLTLYTLDPSLATTNPTASKEALSAALKLTQANILITQEAGDDTNYIRLVEDVIPELRIFNTDDGMPFLAPNFPHLRLAIHTGFDYTDKMGMVPLSDMLCPVDDSQSLVDATGKEVSGTTPLLGELELGQDGVPTKKGKVMTNDEVVKSGVWPEFSSILKKEYREVEGVGVIF